MESNLLNEQTAKMKTEKFQPIGKLAKSNSFKEDSNNTDMINDTSGHQQRIQQINIRKNTSVIYSAECSAANFTHIQTTINHHDKNSFMKTFIRKSGIFAIALLIANLFFAQQSFTQTQTFTTVGTNTFTVPTGVTSVTVECWGGGGAGGGVNGGSFVNRAGGGGSGGTYTKVTSVNVIPGANITV